MKVDTFISPSLPAIIELMPLFSKKEQEIQAVVDLGANSIKGAVFKVEDAGRPAQAGPAGKKIKMIKKTRSPISALQKEKSGHKLHEFLFNMVRELERIPSKITIAIGPHIGEYSIAYWSSPTKGGPKISTAQDARKYFENLFEQHREPEKALVAYPLDIVANGYSMPREFQYSELKKAETLGFRTLMLYLPDTIGADLLDTKESFGGMPIEFVPRVAVYKEAIAGEHGEKDIFLVEVENEAATVALVKTGELLESRTFSFKGVADWGKKFFEELEWFYPVGPIPAEVLLFGEGSELEGIAGLLKNGAWLRDYSFADTPQVRLFEAQSIFKGDTMKGELRGTAEVGLASLAYYSLYHKSLL
jgi:hypothetical protein